MTKKKLTPSMDDKETPSPPTRTSEQWEVDRARGINPVGHPTDRKDVEEKKS